MEILLLWCWEARRSGWRDTSSVFRRGDPEISGGTVV
jgi:hypothetical protein